MNVPGKVDVDINMPEAWVMGTKKADVYVVVVDSGIDYENFDLSDNMWKNTGEIPDNSIDDDGNGYIDDYYGYAPAYFDYINYPTQYQKSIIDYMHLSFPETIRLFPTYTDVVNSFTEEIPYKDPRPWFPVTDQGTDPNIADHGTEVASVFGAVTNNNRRLAGISNNMAIIIPCVSGPFFRYIIKCFRYAADLKKIKNLNIIAVNFSRKTWLDTKELDDAIEYLYENDILLVTSAGNDGVRLNSKAAKNLLLPSLLSSHPRENMITVAATDNQDNLMLKSNYSSRVVHLAAPGEAIPNLKSENKCFKNYCTSDQDQMLYYDSGTSTAAAVVTGVIAFLAATHPEYDSNKIRNLILSSGTKISSLATKTISRRRLLAADTGNKGTGVLTCKNQKYSEIVWPRYNIRMAVGRKNIIKLRNIVCGDPEGVSVTVILTDSNDSELTLYDDGNMARNGDEVAGDGLFSGRYTHNPTYSNKKAKDVTLTFSNTAFKLYNMTRKIETKRDNTSDQFPLLKLETRRLLDDGANDNVEADDGEAVGTVVTSYDENVSHASVVVYLDETIPADLTFDYATIGGTATSNVDFKETTGTGYIASGQTDMVIHIPILNDEVAEPTESFRMTLSNIVMSDSLLVNKELPSISVDSILTVNVNINDNGDIDVDND